MSTSVGSPILFSKSRTLKPKPELTPRQMQAARLMVKGASDKQIAQALGIGTGTAKGLSCSMFKRVGVRGRFAFMSWYQERFGASGVFMAPSEGLGPVRTSVFE